MSPPKLCIKPTPLPLPSLLLTLTIFCLQLKPVLSLSSDGTYLLSFKYSILSDPLNVLQSWNFLDQFPCSWTGVTCSDDLRVIRLSLPNSRLLGSIPSDLGQIDTLRHVDLSGNFLNGTLPATLLNASALQALSLSSNVISGDLPGVYSSSLSYLNLSDNAIGGKLPANFSSLFKNLTVLSLRGNYFSGEVPSGFGSIEVLDLSANLFNGSLPADLGGSGLRYLNLSYNKISGRIPAEFAAGVPENATIDLSFNNLTGQIPKALVGRGLELFSGNLDLCGKPLKNLCIIPSTLSTPPNITSSISPAIAVMPKSLDSSSDTSSDSSSGAAPSSHTNSGIKPATIVGITLADLAGLVILGAIFFYLYQLRLKKQQQKKQQNPDTKKGHPPEKKTQMLSKDNFMVQINTSNEPAPKVHPKCLSKCLRGHESEEGASSDARTSSESDDSDVGGETKGKRENGGASGGELVMVDGETELEVETLLKASAYILGASGSSIVYKAVLQNGITFAVRRLGERGVEKAKDFEGQVRTIAKLRHPNLVRVRGFYWGPDEKLIIYDYVSNGSLASSVYRKNGSTPYHLPLLARLKIARGLARGLAYIHEKRFVHGNIKPSNILLTPDMEPIIGDLGLSWLVHGTKVGGSARQFGSKRFHDGAQEMSVSGSPYISPFSYPNGCMSPYQAPESLKNLKPSPKWDVYSFGIVLLELLTGKVYSDKELGQWTPNVGLEDRYWLLRIADIGLRAEIQGKEEVMMVIFKLGFSCASSVPHRRPSMKEVLQVLDKVLH